MMIRSQQNCLQILQFLFHNLIMVHSVVEWHLFWEDLELVISIRMSCHMRSRIKQCNDDWTVYFNFTSIEKSSVSNLDLISLMFTVYFQDFVVDISINPLLFQVAIKLLSDKIFNFHLIQLCLNKVPPKLLLTQWNVIFLWFLTRNFDVMFLRKGD